MQIEFQKGSGDWRVTHGKPGCADKLCRLVEEGVMENARSDALVLFGATGDLAYKKIFPALQAMIQHGKIDVPIIGVARGGKDMEYLRERVRDSLEKFGGGVDETAFSKLSDLLRCVDGDYQEETPASVRSWTPRNTPSFI